MDATLNDSKLHKNPNDGTGFIFFFSSKKQGHFIIFFLFICSKVVLNLGGEKKVIQFEYSLKYM